MAFDFSRRSYRQWAEFGEERGQAAGWIRWYPCAPGAKVFPGQHAFLMTVWDTDEAPWWDDWGVGPGVYTLPKEGRSNRYKAPAGTHYHGTRQWFTTGIPADVLSGEVPAPLPDQECPVPLSVRDVNGPVVNATYDEVVVIDCDRARSQAVEQVEQGRVRLFDIPTDTRPFIVHRIDGGGTQLVSLSAGHLYWANPGGGDVVYDISGVAGSSPGWWAWFVRQPAGGGTVKLLNGPLPGALSLNDTFLDHIDLVPGQALLLANMTESSGGFKLMHVLSNTMTGSGGLTLGVTPISGGVEGELLRVGAGGVIEETPTVGGFNYV